MSRRIETLVAEAWADLGVGPAETAAALRAAPEVGIDAWKERESVTNHDVAAFVDLLAESVGLGGEWVHFGLTSSDVVDTANGVLMRDAGDLLLGRMGELFEVIRAAARVRKFLMSRRAGAPRLGGIAGGLADLSGLATRIEEAFEPSGDLKDSASDALASRSATASEATFVSRSASISKTPWRRSSASIAAAISAARSGSSMRTVYQPTLPCPQARASSTVAGKACRLSGNSFAVQELNWMMLKWSSAASWSRAISCQARMRFG